MRRRRESKKVRSKVVYRTAYGTLKANLPNKGRSMVGGTRL